jgi:plastocyanin
MSRRRRAFLLVTVLIVLTGWWLLAGCGATPATGSVSPNTIVIKNFAFQPGTLTVPPGATVTVHNEDAATHTVTATGATAFDTGDVAANATTTFTAPTKSGTYPYICSIHNYMQGTLVVH